MESLSISSAHKWPHPRLVLKLKRKTRTDAEDSTPDPKNFTLDTIEKNNPDFCLSCIVNILDLGPNSRALQDRRARDVQYKVLEESANAGCCLCGPLWRDYNELGLGVENFDTIMFQGANKKDISVYIRTLTAVSKALSVIPVSVQRALQDLDDVRLWSLNSPSLTSDNTGSDACWSQVKSWYDKCTTEHSSCALVPQTSAWYPSRLLDVGNSNFAEIQLVKTADAKMETPYVTLSHSWGNARVPKLEVAKKEAFHRGILLQELPKTFSDAVEVTRRLGLRYLWIDSLCILQDSEEDWRYEASMMAKVYQNCYVNISAGSSTDCHGGLFRPRDPATLQRRYASGDLVDEPGKKFLVVESFGWVRHVKDARVNRRSWVLQERVLSRRTIYFGARELFWECRKCSLSETYPRLPLPKAVRTFPTKWCDILERESKDGPLDLSASSSKRDDMLTLWNDWISEYVKGGLSVPSDRLVAISGLAQKTKDVLNDTYLAGLWRSVLSAQLLWHSDGSKRDTGEAAYRPEDYRAPSWSWAAIESDIRTSEPALRGELIEIEEAVVVPLDEGDVTGRVKDGYIKLTGMLFGPAEVSKTQHWFDLVLWGQQSLGEMVYLDVHPATGEDVTDLDCLPVRTTRGASGFIVEGLLLELAVSDPEPRYRRVGYFSVGGNKIEPFVPAVLRWAARAKNEEILPHTEMTSTIVLI